MSILIKDELTNDNIVIFALTADEIINYYKNFLIYFIDFYNSYTKIRRVMDDLINGKDHNYRNKFRNIYENLLTYNYEFLLNNFDSYLKAQDKIDTLYRKTDKW
ncbi:glycogen/starch/alpha-glucan phosphorylase [Clostridium butyricum]|uniref:glycogen/starch/alpha-glucan phosphorylase n=1 Tax=Clostridium butyricum TaxID=1492 RepID=UPI003D10FBC1